MFFRTSNIYDHNITYIKKVGDNYKLYTLRCVRRSGYEEVFNKKKKSNDIKLSNSLSRSKSLVYEYAMCNDFDFFLTLTLDKNKFNRYDLNLFVKRLGKWLNNYNRLYHCHILYLLIPEFHHDGAVHMHGLIANIPNTHLVTNSNGYLCWKKYHDKFGFCSLSRIRDKEACSAYITKYITKNICQRSRELHAHLFYASRGLKKAELLSKGYLAKEDIPSYDFCNEYVSVKTYRDITLIPTLQ